MHETPKSAPSQPNIKQRLKLDNTAVGTHSLP